MDLESNSQPIKPHSVDQDVQDAHDLAAMGHDQALTRKFDMWSMLALAFCVLGKNLYQPLCTIIDKGAQEHTRPLRRI
jgi:hypothetical protein